MSELLVSVAIITYGHENYIRKALDSVLMQETNFDIEIVIGEDYSPDNTREILLEYQEKYPNKFKLILRDENVGATMNLYEVFNASSGNYIALLEGDDYWIDSQKLQKQVDFLQRNPDYIAVSHVIESRDAITDEPMARYPKECIRGREVTINHFLNRTYYSGTATMFRNVCKERCDYFSLVYQAHRYVGDFTYCLLLLNLGRVFVLADCMAVYRVRRMIKDESNYNSQKTQLDQFEDHVQLFNYINYFFDGKYDLSKTYAHYVRSGLGYALRNNEKLRFWNTYKKIPRKYIFRLWIQVFGS